VESQAVSRQARLKEVLAELEKQAAIEVDEGALAGIT